MGHYGEALPFLVDRVDRAYMQAEHAEPGDRTGQQGAGELLPQEEPVGDHQRQLPAGGLLLHAGRLGMDRILLGTDFPYEEMEDCMKFLRSLPLTDDEKSKLYEENAKALGF